MALKLTWKTDGKMTRRKMIDNTEGCLKKMKRHAEMCAACIA